MTWPPCDLLVEARGSIQIKPGQACRQGRNFSGSGLASLGSDTHSPLTAETCLTPWRDRFVSHRELLAVYCGWAKPPGPYVGFVPPAISPLRNKTKTGNRRHRRVLLFPRKVGPDLAKSAFGLKASLITWRRRRDHGSFWLGASIPKHAERRKERATVACQPQRRKAAA